MYISGPSRAQAACEVPAALVSGIGLVVIQAVCATMTTRPVARGEPIELNLDDMTVDQGLKLIEDERVRPLLTYLSSGVFENKTNLTFMKAYSVVVQFGDQQQHSLKLYAYYKKVIVEYCDEGLASVSGIYGGELIAKLADNWEKQTILTFWMQRVFQYLDRFFTKNTVEYPELFTIALRLFKEKVYEMVKDRMVAAIIDVINKERDGHDVSQDTLRQLIELLCTVGDMQPKIVKQKDGTTERLMWVCSSRDIYKAEFESKLMNSTAEYYKKKVTGWMAECSCPLFLQEVERRLQDEDGRLSRYLDRSSGEPLREVCQRELILNTAKQLVEMDSGCQHMFVNSKHDDLTLMYRLFRREPTMLPYMTGVMEPYIETRCTKIVEDQENIDNPPQYIEQVLELKKELDEMVSRCFENDSSFQKARNRGFQNVLNKDTRCAKYLALYADLQLKKGLKGRNEDETQGLVNSVVALFAHLKDKDIFLDYYKRSLSKRLLNKLSISTDAEEAFISKLKVEIGQQAIQKLQSMFTDMTLSDQFQREYNEQSHRGSPGGVCHEVRVLQTNAWPEKADEANIVPCEEMVQCIKGFEAFYESKHSGRKLRWIYNMGQVEVAALCFERKYIFVMSAYQCLALMLFNKRKSITFKEIAEATKVPAEECRRHLLSMTVSKHRLLKHNGDDKKIDDGTQLEVNDAFVNERVKVTISLIKEKEKATEAAVAVAEAPVERKHVVDAAIVRVMKARKKLDHNSLLEEVFRQCTLFKPQPSQIKVQIEHLIDREFLKRDAEKRNIYIYLP
mmetsp:Transcript_9325/g.23197  ORF Transcript_9325/g.23197 Transcript_9325/m.23197 type:complete len:791 (-) Transcript_9325:254-2626(-)